MPAQAWDLTPWEVALLMKAERYRRNEERILLAWSLAVSVGPHVSKKHAHRVTPRALALTCPGVDFDEEDLLDNG
jgi:hypothetical protein